MTILVAAITVSCLALAWERFGRVARWSRPAGQIIVDEELRLAQMRLPAGWRQARDLNEAVAIAAKIPVGKFGAVEVRPVMEF